MGFKNLPAHMQRIMDEKLREDRSFARAFIDDMVIFSLSAQGHLKHLHITLALFREMSISLSPRNRGSRTHR